MEEIKTIEEQICICDASLKSLEARASSINRTMSIGNKEEKFIEINHTTKQTKQYCNVLLDLRREMSEFDVKFEQNVVLSDKFHCLGTVSAETFRVR